MFNENFLKTEAILTDDPNIKGGIFVIHINDDEQLRLRININKKTGDTIIRAISYHVGCKVKDDFNCPKNIIKNIVTSSGFFQDGEQCLTTTNSKKT